MADLDPSSLTHHGVCFVPVLHGRMEFAVLLRQAWDQFQPRAVAVELPRGLDGPVKEAVDRLPNLSVVVRPQEGKLAFLLIEPTDAIMEALRLAAERNLPAELIDAEVEGYPAWDEPWPDSYAAGRLGLARFAQPFINQPPPASAEDDLREKTMAHHLQRLVKNHGRVIFVCGLAHAGRIIKLLDFPQPRPLARSGGRDARPANLDPDSIPEVSQELPWLMRAFEAWRSSTDTTPPDRLTRQEELLDKAAAALEKEACQEIKPWQMRTLRRFRRNWALLSGRLSADFYQLVISSRGVGGDEFAWQVWQKAVDYPFTDLHPGWDTLRLRAEDLGHGKKTIRFFKPLRRTRPRLVPLPSRRQHQEAYPGQWSEFWNQGAGICSFQPEDLIIEDFGRRAAKRALDKQAQGDRRIEPFTTSLLDGIDFKETIRRAAEKKIFVYENRPAASKVGAIIIVFDPDEGPREKYPWALTWLGEHQDESDMAFYATQPGEDIIGPGVSRCRYGGLVMTYPPLRMVDVWTDPFFEAAKNKTERLILAGADYSQQRLIAFIAAEPPSHRIRTMAARLDRQIAFLPIGSFAAQFIEKIRTFHVLNSHAARAWAAEFIHGPGRFKAV